MKNLSSLSSETKGVSSLSTKGKIGFFSVILISINSTIGSGIFFKTDQVMKYSNHSVLFVILSWAIACFGIVCLAIAVCEISSKCTGNLGITGWCQKFSTKYIYSASKNFLVYIYGPTMFFFTPIFVIKYFQHFLATLGVASNFGTSNDWLIWSFVSFCIICWFFLTSGLSNRVANWQNLVITCVKFVPIFATILVGTYILSKGESQPIHFLPEKAFFSSATDLFTLTPFIGLFGSLSSIVFTYGGFYSVTSIRTKMKNPSKNGTAILIAISVISTIYFTIAMIMTFSYSGEGLFYDFFEKHKSSRWVLAILYLTISFGILGIVNGAVIFAVNLIRNLIDNGEIIIPCRLFNKSVKIRELFGVGLIFGIYLIAFVVFSLIGGLGYFPEGGKSQHDAPGYDSMARLINFANVVGSWTIIFTFVFISLAVFGALRRRKEFGLTRKRFIWTGWVSFSLISVCTVFLLLQPLADIIFILCKSSFPKKAERLRGNGLTFGLLLVFLSIMLIPIIFEKRIFIDRKHFLEHMLVFTEKLSFNEINEFMAKDHAKRIAALKELGIHGHLICHTLAGYHWHKLFNSDEQRLSFNESLRQNILKISGILEH